MVPKTQQGELEPNIEPERQRKNKGVRCRCSETKKGAFSNSHVIEESGEMQRLVVTIRDRFQKAVVFKRSRKF